MDSNKKIEEQEDWFAEDVNSIEAGDSNIEAGDLDAPTANEEQEVLDDMPSANSAGRDGTNKKKMQLAALGLAGVTAILLGVGVSVAKYEDNREAERVLEAEAAAKEQKQLANSDIVDITADQQSILHDLPPPDALNDGEGNLGLATQDAPVAPQAQPLPDMPSPEPYTPAPSFEPIPNSAFMTSAPSYTPPAPVEMPEAVPSPSISDSFMPQAPTVVEITPPPVKGSQSSVLVDAAPRRVSATSTDNQGEPSKVGGNLRPTVLAGATAGRRGDTSLMLLKGATIPCVLETKIDSTYQGFASCRLSKDVYSTNGKTLVLERGTRVIGEQNTDINQGQARVAILWTRAETPKGVSINLDSPAAGQLGEMGVNAKVKTHFWKRFGNSIMLSLIQDAISAGTKRFEDKNTNGDNNTTIENTSSSVQNMAEQALTNSINIPPTAIINQGTVINISVARDIDFSSVYGIKRR